jgi:aspartate dehydrogenase
MKLNVGLIGCGAIGRTLARAIVAGKAVAENALGIGKDMLIMSVGALSDDELLNRLEEVAREMKAKIYLPSDAICRLDGVKGASVEGIDAALITSTKHPRGLEGAQYLVENQIDLSNLTEPRVIFQGTARDAIGGFPKNVNVAVALSLAGIGVDRTTVKIIADPGATKTQHEIWVEGDFGELTSKVRNRVHPSNPKTSYLATLAAIRTLSKLSEPIQLGT